MTDRPRGGALPPAGRSLTPWATGVLVGLAAGLWIAFLAGSGSVDAFVRVTGDGQYLLDTRVDESAVGRLVNIPIASLGDLSVKKQAWLVATAYSFTLQVRPELVRGSERPMAGLLVSARLPGRVLTTNASRVAGGTATWEGLPPDGLQLRTVAIHWVRVAILIAALVAAVGFRRS